MDAPKRRMESDGPSRASGEHPALPEQASSSPVMASASTDSAVNRVRFSGMDYAPTASFPLVKKAYDAALARYGEEG